ncbi:MAG: FAD binding domain-containing protein, partial [Gemmatimonadota bacterium]|nr:FAD binding domain-containing protein [Gemmatimonadota bacterium]
NQTEFWRGALGYCLKKDGTVCHVTKVGKKCVAAHSADTPPNLIALGATLALAGPGGAREIPAAEFFLTDGIWNTRRARDEVLTEIRIPVGGPCRRSAYRKLRQRHSIDFPLLSVAVTGDFDENGVVERIGGVVSALGARPRVLAGWDEIAVGGRLEGRVIDALADRAYAQCRPLENIIVDAEWRRAMVRVHVRRALAELAGTARSAGNGSAAGP